MAWENDQKWESSWWGDCLNTYNEEKKQFIYAQRMGINLVVHERKSPYYINLNGKSVIDIGGGPVSLLLKSVSGSMKTVVDPLAIPEWVKQRYAFADIAFIQSPAEDIRTGVFESGDGKMFDEAWIYNCLQHTMDPEKIIANARKIAKVIRIFEWVDTPAVIGHPQTLTEVKLNKWLGGFGKVENVNQDGVHGKAYYGVFPTK